VTGKRRAGKPAKPAKPVKPPKAASPGVAPSTAVIAPRKSRRDLRADRRRQRRRRMGVVGVGAVVLAVAIVGAAIGFGVNRATSGSSTPKDPQTTLLVTLQGDDGNAVAAMLAAHDAHAKQGVELLVPSRLITDVCGFGSQQFGQIIGLPNGDQLARRTLSQVLGGVTVDGTWTFSPQQLAKLVTIVGGVTVDVDTDVLRQQGGSTLVVVPAGKGQHLDGASATAFASYQGPTEDATAVLSRFQAVFQAAIDALPSKSSAAATVLTGAGAHASVPADTLAALLTSLAHDDKTDALLPVDLPSKPIDTGGGVTSYRVDPVELPKLVHSRLASSLPASARQKKPTVLIENGAGTSGLVTSACDRLLPAGYGFAGSGNAPNFNYTTSQIIVFSDSVAAARVGNDIARLLKLPEGDVVASSQGQNVADVVVILGHDYRP
jgi:anionic cell wall polymer biosynthesis LytR-Cps2A-Psr (LCP) family protein